MDWSGRRVLVTGAGGFIGSHLTEALVQRGAQVRALVRYNSRGNPGNLIYAAPTALRAIEIVSGDLRDPEAVRRATIGIDTIFHLGALIAIPAGYYFMNKWLQGFAYRIHVQWWIFALALTMAVMIAMITVSFQAIRAALANPVKSLRTE